jgi:hypothetical protein
MIRAGGEPEAGPTLSFAPQKTEYRAAIDELETQVGNCMISLERMKRFRFKSQSKENEVAAYIYEGAAKLAPLIAKCNLDGAVEWFRQIEAAAKEY